MLDQLDRELVTAKNIIYPPEEELPPEARLFWNTWVRFRNPSTSSLKGEGFLLQVVAFVS